MARFILTSLVLAILILPVYAQSTVYTDGRSVNTYTDRYGSTTGWVGGKYQNTYSDGYGGTTGTIGNKRVNTLRQHDRYDRERSHQPAYRSFRRHYRHNRTTTSE